MAKRVQKKWKVSTSKTGPSWRLPKEMDRELAAEAAEVSGLDEAVTSSIVRAESFVRKDDMKSLLYPSMRDIVTPKNTVPGMAEAGQLIASTLADGGRIAVFADYDPDGTCSAAALARVIRQIGADESQVSWSFAGAQTGFGLTNEFVEQAADEGCSVLVTLDCGSGQAEEIKTAHGLGMSTIVVDHHHVDPECKPTWHLNPQAHEGFDSKNTGAGLGWKLATMISASVQGVSSKELWQKPLYLAGFGSRADMAPHLDPEHRAMFWLSLDKFDEKSIPIGIRKLAEIIGEDPAWPGGLIRTSACLNLPKRTIFVDAGIVAELLWTDHEGLATETAAYLASMYEKAILVHEAMTAEALEQVEENNDPNFSWSVLDDYEGYPGYAGTVANNLARSRGGVAVCMVRRSDGRYKVAVRGRVPDRNRKLGDLLDDEAMIKACTLSDGVVSLGGHDSVVSGACERDSMADVLRAVRVHAVDGDEKKNSGYPDEEIFWVSALNVSGERVQAIDEQTRRMAPYNSFEKYYPPSVGVVAEVVSTEEVERGVRMELDSDGVELSIITKSDIKIPKKGEKKHFCIKFNGAAEKWCNGYTDVEDQAS